MDPMEHLLKFRSEHPCQYLDVGKVRWEYLAGGGGKKTLLLLPGGLRIAENAFGYMELLEGKYRVLIPTYPPLASMEQMTDGIAAVLDAENVQSAYVFGQSAGGIVAQVFVQRFPSRVDKLILSGTSPLRNPMWKTGILWLYNKIIPRLSEATVRKMYRNMIGQVMDIPESRQAFWKAYLDELFSTRLTKADVISHFRTGDDALRRYGYDRPGVKPWPGEVLILGGEKDPVSTDSDRKIMASFYPRARIRVIPGAGHTPAISQPEKFQDAVNDFFSG